MNCFEYSNWLSKCIDYLYNHLVEMHVILKYEFRRENSLELGVRFGHLTVWIELFELRTLKLNDQSDNNLVMLLKTPELEVDILSVDIQCGTPVRYPDFNNYTEELIKMMRMDWRTSGLSDNWNLEIETNCEASGRVRWAMRNLSSG